MPLLHPKNLCYHFMSVDHEWTMHPCWENQVMHTVPTYNEDHLSLMNETTFHNSDSAASLHYKWQGPSPNSLNSCFTYACPLNVFCFWDTLIAVSLPECGSLKVFNHTGTHTWQCINHVSIHTRSFHTLQSAVYIYQPHCSTRKAPHNVLTHEVL